MPPSPREVSAKLTEGVKTSGEKLLQSPYGASSLKEGAFCRERRLDAALKRFFAKAAFASSTADAVPLPQKGKVLKKTAGAVFCFRSNQTVGRGLAPAVKWVRTANKEIITNPFDTSYQNITPLLFVTASRKQSELCIT